MRAQTIQKVKSRRVVVVKVRHKGEDLELDMTPLSARQQDEINRIYPEVRPPRIEDKDGKKYFDRTDPEYLDRENATARDRLLAMACKMLGAEFFGTPDMMAQMDLLAGEFDSMTILDMVRQCGAAETTRDLDAEADAVIRPTV